MSQANTVATLNGNFKEVYADKIKDLVPDGVKLYNMIDFEGGEKATGNIYHQPISLQLEHGFTYGGTAGNVFGLNSAIAGTMKDAQVQGHEMVLRSAVSVGAVSRSEKNAFEKATKHVVANMLRSFTRRLEVQMLYGKRGLGAIETAPSGNEQLNITDATWAPGIWSGAETMLVDIYQSDLTTLRKANVEIASVDFDNRRITATTGVDGVVQAGDVIFYKGSNGNEFDGIDNIIRNTGTLFNISASSYNLWKGNVLSNGGSARDLSFELISHAVTRLMEKGLSDREVVVMVNPIQYDVLLAEQDAKRMYDSSWKADKLEAGGKGILFHSQNGAIKIESSIYVKAGSAYVLSLDEFKRIGSRDITFDQPGFEGEFFRLLPDSNGYELRAYTDQALFCSAPGYQAVIDDLSVPSAAYTS